MNLGSRRWGVLLVAAALSAALTACAGTTGDRPVIRLADSYPETHPFAEFGVSEFNQRLEGAGFGVEYFPAGQMGSPQDLATLVETDVVTVGPASAAYLEDQLPLSSVSDLPAMATDACVAANAMMDLLSEGGILYEQEYADKGLRPLWISIIPNYEILTADRKVQEPEDLRGLILRSSGGAFDVTMRNTRAQAAGMPAQETYEAMSRGIVDGTAMPYVSVIPYRLDEVAQYSTDGLNLGSVGIPYVISEDAWDDLSPEERHTVAEAGRTANQSLCEGLNSQYQEARQYMRDQGVELTEVDAGQGAWEETLEPVRRQWAQSLDGAGLPGTEVLEAYEDALARHEGAGDE